MDSPIFNVVDDSFAVNDAMGLLDSSGAFVVSSAGVLPVHPTTVKHNMQAKRTNDTAVIIFFIITHSNQIVLLITFLLFHKFTVSTTQLN